jgi:hypothetical protein
MLCGAGYTTLHEDLLSSYGTSDDNAVRREYAADGHGRITEVTSLLIPWDFQLTQGVRSHVENSPAENHPACNNCPMRIIFW